MNMEKRQLMITRKISMLLLLLLLAGCQKVGIATGKPCAEVERVIRGHYVAKYPSFAELVALRNPTNVVAAEVRVGELYRICPVTEMMNSYPHGPYLTFTEKTEASTSMVHVLTLDLYAEKDGTCRVEAIVEERKKRNGEPVAMGKPVTEAQLRKMLR